MQRRRQVVSYQYLRSTLGYLLTPKSKARPKSIYILLRRKKGSEVTLENTCSHIPATSHAPLNTLTSFQQTRADRVSTKYFEPEKPPPKKHTFNGKQEDPPHTGSNKVMLFPRALYTQKKKRLLLLGDPLKLPLGQAPAGVLCGILFAPAVPVDIDRWTPDPHAAKLLVHTSDGATLQGSSLFTPFQIPR